MVSEMFKAVTLRSVLENLQEVIEEAQNTGKTKYPTTNMTLADDGTLIIDIYIKDNGELSHVYDKAKDLFDDMADRITIQFDSQEIDGKKHWIMLEFQEIVDGREDKNE